MQPLYESLINVSDGLHLFLTLVIFAKDPESFLKLILCVRISYLFVHQVTKFRELNKSGAIHIDLKIELSIL